MREYVDEAASVRTGTAELSWPSGRLHLLFQWPTSCYRGGVIPLILSRGKGKGSFTGMGEWGSQQRSITSFLNWNYKERGESVSWHNEVMLYRDSSVEIQRLVLKKAGPIHLAVQQGQDKKSANQACKKQNSSCSWKTWEPALPRIALGSPWWWLLRPMYLGVIDFPESWLESCFRRRPAMHCGGKGTWCYQWESLMSGIFFEKYHSAGQHFNTHICVGIEHEVLINYSLMSWWCKVLLGVDHFSFLFMAPI